MDCHGPHQPLLTCTLREALVFVLLTSSTHNARRSAKSRKGILADENSDFRAIFEVEKSSDLPRYRIKKITTQQHHTYITTETAQDSKRTTESHHRHITNQTSSLVLPPLYHRTMRSTRFLFPCASLLLSSSRGGGGVSGFLVSFRDAAWLHHHHHNNKPAPASPSRIGLVLQPAAQSSRPPP